MGLVTANNRIIDSDFPIKPSDISADISFSITFRYANMELAAVRIVHFCQDRKRGWEPFTKREIFAFLYRVGVEKETVYGFAEEEPTFLSALTWISDKDRLPWIVEKEGTYYVTEEFVALCYRGAPQREAPRIKI